MKNCFKKTNHFLKQAINIMLCLCMVFAPYAFALEFKIGHGVSARGTDANGVLKSLGTLKKGSIVRIPEKYAKKFKSSKYGSRGFKGLLDWLAKAGQLEKSYFKDRKRKGKMRVGHDYFFPVEIVDAKGSKITGKPKQVKIAIRWLKRRRGIRRHTHFETRKAAKVYPVKKKKRVFPRPKEKPIQKRAEQLSLSPTAGDYRDSATETLSSEIVKGVKPGVLDAAGNVDHRYISDMIAPPSGQFRCANLPGHPIAGNPGAAKLIQFINEMKPHMQKAMSVADNSKGNRGGPEFAINTFNQSCGKAKFKDFYKLMKSYSRTYGVDPKILLSIMSQESGGRCFVAGDNSQSRGLFQINFGSTKIPACSASQISVIKASSVAQLESNVGLKCLENPVVNLKESVRILRNKFFLVNDYFPDADRDEDLRWGVRGDNHDGRMRKRDLWRKAVAAYNGGQGGMYRAFRDIRKFNKENGTDFKADRWQDRSTMMFLRHLDNAKSYVRRPGSQRRELEDTIGNVAYVESAVGKEFETDSSPLSHVSQWDVHLKQNSFD